MMIKTLLWLQHKLIKIDNSKALFFLLIVSLSLKIFLQKLSLEWYFICLDSYILLHIFLSTWVSKMQSRFDSEKKFLLAC